MTTQRHPLPVRALRHGLSAEVLNDRACADTIDAAFVVHEALGVLHNEETYRRALAVEISERGLTVHQQASFSVVFKTRVVGTFVADLLIENRLMVQVTSDKTLTPDAKTETVRGLSAGGIKTGLVFNFGTPELFFARIL